MQSDGLSRRAADLVRGGVLAPLGAGVGPVRGEELVGDPFEFGEQDRPADRVQPSVEHDRPAVGLGGGQVGAVDITCGLVVTERVIGFSECPVLAVKST